MRYPDSSRSLPHAPPTPTLSVADEKRTESFQTVAPQYNLTTSLAILEFFSFQEHIESPLYQSGPVVEIGVSGANKIAVCAVLPSQTGTQTDGETLKNQLGEGLFPGEHSLDAGRTEISYGKRISLRH